LQEIAMLRLAAASILAGALALASTSALAAPPPKVSIKDYAQLKTPLPYPYNEKANADAQLNQAIAKAKTGKKRVLVDLGGNWCGDCRILAATMELPEMKRFIDQHFVVVSIDVGRFDKNLQIPAKYGFHERLEGVPALLVVDTVSGKQIVGKQQIAELADARHMAPQELANWIAKWTK
jgi:thiol-disulfide isomerase/thioredoxin